jgi:hypothetical protein
MTQATTAQKPTMTMVIVSQAPQPHPLFHIIAVSSS